MTFQIRAIHLYSSYGEPRSLRFDLNSVNIITGRSRTGKSSIIDIIDYCLGSEKCNVAAGIIRQTVSMYCIELETNDGIVVIARAAPRGRNKTNSQFHVSYRARDAGRPEFEELTANSDISSAVIFLSRVLGIDENITDAGAGLRAEFDVTIRHALYFCIQDQDEIASQDVLFHSQAEDYRPQAIRDVLPYFLGVVDPTYLTKRERLRARERELRLLQRQASDEAALAQAPGRAAALVAEAVALGLVTEPEDSSRISALEALTRAAQADSDPQLPIEPADELAALLSEREELRGEFSRLKAAQRRFQRSLRYDDDFNGEAQERVSRLRSLDLLRLDSNAPESTSVCPLCDSQLSDSVTSVEEIRDQLELVSRQIADVGLRKAADQSAASIVDQRLAELGSQLVANQQQVNQASAAVDLFESIRDVALQRAAVRGRISLFLSSVSLETESTFLSDRIAELNREIAGLRIDLDPELVAERLQGALSRISFRMTDTASKLDLEHSPAPVRLDIRGLTLIVDTAYGSYRLAEIGSGENILGYHLAMVIGLHSYFRENRRPLPRFLLLDQPSQVYFPPDHSDDISLDADHTALTNIFDTLFVFTEAPEYDEGFQILVMEHADLSDERFGEAVIERWRADGKALIPESWIECLSASQEAES